MAVTPSGAYTFDPVNGIYKVGYDQDSSPATPDVGTLIVDGGTNDNLTASDLDAGDQQWLEIGNAAGSNGTVTVTGFGSEIQFGNAGLEDTGSGLLIGRNGGVGTLDLQFGTTFRIYDQSSGAVDSPDYLNEEYVSIGRGSGSTGQLSALSATFQIVGNASFMEVGVYGGIGHATLTGGSYVDLEANGAGADSEVFLRIGVGAGSVGTVSLDISTMAFVAAPGSYADFVVGGGGGSGQLELHRASTFVLNGGAQGAEATVGDDVGGIGRLVIDSGSYLSFQGGSGYDGLVIGRNGGTGTVDVTGDSVLRAVSGGLGGYLTVGLRGGSRGTVNVTDSTIWVQSTSTADGGIDIGRDEGTGVVNLHDQALVHIESAGFADFNVGFDDGFGIANFEAGATVEMTGDRAYAAIGAYRGIGQVMVDGGQWTFTATTFAGIDIGEDGSFDGEDSGHGNLTLRNGAAISFNSGTQANLNVGGGAGSTAQLGLYSGSIIDLNTANAGSSEGVFSVASFGAAVSVAILDGVGTEIKGIDYAAVGYDSKNSFSVAGGHGDLLIRNGAEITVGDVMRIGAGGSVGGKGGTINGHVELVGSSKIDLRDGQFGDFTVNGDVLVDRAGNRLMVDAGAGGQNDRLIAGNASTGAAGQIAISLNVLSGYKFAAGEIRTIVDATSIAGTLPAWSASGQHADFAFYGGTLPGHSGELVFKALNNGASGGLGIVDFGVGGPPASVVYDATAGGGTIKGGVFGSSGGRAYNIDKFLGTDFNDTITITGTAARPFNIDGRGGADVITAASGPDVLAGGAGNDVLSGGRGNDILTGGVGNDVFVFNTVLSASANRDTIIDFANLAGNNDAFRLENAIFTKLAVVGALNPAFFHNGASAADANDYVIYNKATGALLYDPNGSGAGGAIQFAVLTNKPTLAASDFVVI